ncbi:MAG: sensor histidine kinase, partial [Porcipelethomonas sp.]
SKKTTVTKSTAVSDSSSAAEPDKTRMVPDDKKIGDIEPDPFKGKVKRSYVYVEFNDINSLEENIYQYCTCEDEEDVKEAVKTIYNNNEERGKINIGDNKYRYMFRYNPPKMNYSVVMLDRTLETNTINRLMITFIIIAGAGLILIFFISLVLSNWTIKPVEKAWTQQKEFIANASHELKTPLTVISTNTDVVLSNPEDSVENQSKWLNYIKNETIRMSKLVNNLLCIAKYDANKVEVINSRIDLSNLVSSICLQYEPLVFENKKTLITEIDDNIEIMGDEDKIKQVVNILMDNALKYSLNNGTIKVLLKRTKQSSVCMTISNTSEDIPQEQLDKLFDRFYRVEDSRNRKTGGSGLGLNIAKTIVESHKGSISVINRDNITSFIVTF